ncbi:hypothetical protein ACQJBY_062874 [Aegilops geniculata]
METRKGWNYDEEYLNPQKGLVDRGWAMLRGWGKTVAKLPDNRCQRHTMWNGATTTGINPTSATTNPTASIIYPPEQYNTGSYCRHCPHCQQEQATTTRQQQQQTPASDAGFVDRVVNLVRRRS